MAKKKPHRKRKNDAVRTWTGFRLSQAAIDDLADLVECCRAEAPPYLKITNRLVLELVIHHAKKLKDEGELSYSAFFGFPVETQGR